MNGKGSQRRPSVVTDAEQRDRWAATFGVDTPENGSRLRHNATQNERRAPSQEARAEPMRG